MGSSILSGGKWLPEDQPIALLLIQMTIILIITRLLGGILKRHLKQPVVISELLVGIILGPSCLGRLIPSFIPTFFPTSSLEGLSLLANFGLVLYLFLVGLELDPTALIKTGRASIMIALCGIFLPFFFAIGVAQIFFYFILQQDPNSSSHVSLVTLTVFVGVGVSITAFPVLARILHESKLIETPLGSLVLAAAGFNDFVAWSLLALAVALVDASEPQVAIYILLVITLQAIFLVLVVRPFLGIIINKVNKINSRSWKNGLLALVFICIFVSSYFTEIVGTDAIFGAFLIGVILPRDKALVRVVEKIEDIVMIVFLPLYFTLSGLKTDLGAIVSLRSIAILALVLTASVGGKVIGCGAAARLSRALGGAGLSKRESLTVGILMNTRGLVELIVLNIGLKAHVINTEIFTIMVLMALITTAMTSPMVRIIYPKKLWDHVAQAKEQEEFSGNIRRITSSNAILEHRRVSRLRSLSPTSMESLGGSATLNVLTVAYDSKWIVSGLYLLSSAQRTTSLLISSFIDGTSTATVIDKRLGNIRNPEAREIKFAASFFNINHCVVKQLVCPSRNVGSELVQLIRNRPVGPLDASAGVSSSSAPSTGFDVVLLPWTNALDEHQRGNIDYEASMWSALSYVDAVFILYCDHGMPLPRITPGATAAADGSCRHQQHYSVCFFFHNYELTSQTAVLEIAANWRRRKDMRLHVVVYQAVSQTTLDILQQLKLPPLMVAGSEQELLDHVASQNFDLLVYGFETPLESEASGAGGLSTESSHQQQQHHRISSLTLSSLTAPLRLTHRLRSASPPGADRPLLQGAPNPAAGGGYGLRGSDSSDDPSSSSSPRDLITRLCLRLKHQEEARLPSLMEIHAGKGAGVIPLEETPEQESHV